MNLLKPFLKVLVVLFVSSLGGVYASEVSPISDALLNQDGQISEPLKLLFVFTIISIVPALLISMTAFTRIIIVLSILRQALGLQSTPPNIVLISIAVFLTVLSLKPIVHDAEIRIVTPWESGALSDREAFDEITDIVTKHLQKHVREDDYVFIDELVEGEGSELFTLIPAYMLSELRIAFEIGFLILIPFLLIDIIVASTLMAVGMIMVPPLIISLPIKLLVFVMVDGWKLVIEALFKTIV
jgi:flagellar biosynthetic protein FliP